MKSRLQFLFVMILLGLSGSVAFAQAESAAAAEPAAPRADFLEYIVNSILQRVGIEEAGSTNTLTHYLVSAGFVVLAFLLRGVVLALFFRQSKKLASRTKGMIDNHLISAVERPVGVFVMLIGIFGALKVLVLPENVDVYIGVGATVAFSLTIFWGLLRAFSALLDHAHRVAQERELGVAAFMPWIKKSLIAIFFIIGLLLVIQGLGYDVKTLLAGLGIGGLAFALAAQDTIANLFGSIVVAIDQPFKVGEFIKIGGEIGGVEEIGLRSTKIRLKDKSLLIVPNRTVAGEMITNFARFTQRRTEQVIGLTYDSTPEQMDGIVEEFRGIIRQEAEVDPSSVMVFFRDFGPSSLDIWVVYVATDPDFQKYMRLRQRLNLAFMRAVEARGLSFAFPTQTVHLDGPVAKQLAERKG